MSNAFDCEVYFTHRARTSGGSLKLSSRLALARCGCAARNACPLTSHMRGNISFLNAASPAFGTFLHTNACIHVVHISCKPSQRAMQAEMLSLLHLSPLGIARKSKSRLERRAHVAGFASNTGTNARGALLQLRAP